MKTKIILISMMATLLGACQPDSKTSTNDGDNQTDSTLLPPENMNPYTYGIDISSHQGREIELMDQHAILPGVYKGTLWQLWQRLDSYENDNVKNDFDVFNGDLSAFMKFVQTY